MKQKKKSIPAQSESINKNGNNFLSISIYTICGILLILALFFILKNQISSSNKVLLIGVDGADWRIINQLIDKGDLPNWKEIKENGTTGNLRSMEPLLSPMIWTTIATGKTPDKHGVAWFMSQNEATGHLIPVTVRDRKTKALWNILSSEKKTVGVIGWWASWPAEKVNGFVVSDYAASHGYGVASKPTMNVHKITYPEELEDTLEKDRVSPEELPKNIITQYFNELKDSLSGKISGHELTYSNLIDHLRLILSSTQTYANLGLELYRKQRPDVMMIYFEGTDSVGHLFMKYAPPKATEVSDDDFKKYQNVVYDFYRYQDEILGQWMKEMNGKTTLIIVSDHGFKIEENRPESMFTGGEGKAHESHAINGVIAMYGYGVKKGYTLTNASVIDVTPTILYLMGLPKGEDMDGKVLSDAFTLQHEVTTIASYDSKNKGSLASSGEEEPTEEISQETLERLKSLGYISPETSAQSESNLGFVYMQKKEYAKAIEEFQKAIAKKPDFAIARGNLGWAYMENGDYIKALSELDIAMKLKPDEPSFHILMGDTYRKMGELEKAQKIYQDLLKKHPKNSKAMNGLGEIALLNKDYTQAIDWFQKGLAQDSKNPLLYYNLGLVYLAENKLKQAAEALQKTIQLDPKHSFAHNNLGNCYYQQGNMDQAIQEYQLAIQTDSTNLDANYNLGSMYYLQKQYPQAIEQYNKVVSLDFSLLDAHKQLVLAYLESKDYINTEKQLNLILKLANNSPFAYYQFARLRVMQGQKTQAKEYLDKAIKSGGTSFQQQAKEDSLLKSL